VLLLILAITLTWLLASASGRDVVLGQVVARLPEGGVLEWGRAEGVLLGMLSLHDVRYAQQDSLEITAKRLAVNIALWRLLGGQVRLNTLAVENAALVLPPSSEEDSPFTLPQWPEVLPEIELPLTLGIDAIVIDGVSLRQNDTSLIEIHTLHGGVLARDGEVHIHDLSLHSNHGKFRVDGRYQPGQRYRTHLTASARLPDARFGLAIRGDLDALDMALVGYMPGRVEARWALRETNLWTLTAHSDAFNVNANGNGGDSHWQGRLQQDDWSAILHPSTVRLEGQRLEIDEWQLDIANGTHIKGQLHASGHAEFSPEHSPQFALALSGKDWALGDAAITLQSTLNLNGQFDHWQASGHATVARDGQQASVHLRGQGDADGVRLTTLNAHTPSGQLDASGQLTWGPSFSWDARGVLDGFDPGYFSPDWPGAVNARLSSRGHTDINGDLQIEANAHDLGGQLRQRALAGEAQFTLNTRQQAIHGSADLRLGTSRIEVSADTRRQLNIEATFSPLKLADLWPDAEGELQGRVQLTGTRVAPDLVTELTARNLTWGEYKLARLNARGHLPWQRGEGALTLDASEINTGIALDQITLNLTGSTQRLQLTAEARAPALTVTTRASINSERQQRQATIDTFRLAPATGADWQLQSPLELTARGPRWTLSHGCLTSTDNARLCASADWPQSGVQLEARALPLLLLSPWLQTLLPEYSPGQPWILRGQIDLNANARPDGHRWQGALSVYSPSGQLRTHEAAKRDVISYQALALSADFAPDHLRATLDVLLPDPAQTDAATPGRLNAELATGWELDSPIQGQLTLNMRDLTWLELFSADIASPGGQFSADVQLTGTRTSPYLAGQARLHDLTAELPALAIHLQQGEITLTAQSDRPAQINGQIHSGEGALSVRGSLDWRAPDLPLNLHLTGDNLTAANTRDLKLTIAPDLTIQRAANQPLTVTGHIRVLSALLELERLDSGVPVSPDVVVLDPAKPRQGTDPTALRLDLNLIMGEDVRLRGFGLDGTLGGELRLHTDPGREMTGTGRLEVSGGYKAYGQALTITRAELEFTNGPLTDPLIEMSAERKIELEEMTAGLTVTGRASAPEVQVWTNPATDSSQALSWLAFGRSMSSLTSAETQQFNTAQTALSAGGNLLAGQIGRRLGLDDAGISTSRTLGESVLGIGKQISPRLYVGVGVSMIGNGQVLTLKYLLRKGFDVEIESSTLESRGSVNWRHESN